MRHSPRGFKRTDRIADQIQRDLAVVLQREIQDPRVGMVTVSGVKVSKDLAFADVYVSFMGVNSETDCRESVRVLEHASGYLRSVLAREIDLRSMPRLRFHYDSTLVNGARISRLIDEAMTDDGSRKSVQVKPRIDVDDEDMDNGGAL